jgi:uncharacterized membrane protein (UPF0182 family)
MARLCRRLLRRVKACSYWLDRFLLLYDDNGVVVGASYTGVHVELPVLWGLIGLSLIAAIATWANLQIRTYKLPVAATVLVFGNALVLAEVFPVLFERLFVKLDELRLEQLTSRGTSGSPERLTIFIGSPPNRSRRAEPDVQHAPGQSGDHR